MSGLPLLAGFKSPSEAAQRCFRAVLGAVAEPGLAQTLERPLEAPEGCAWGTASLGLALLDSSTTFHVHGLAGLSGYLRFHTGAIEREAGACQWAFAQASSADLLGLAQSLSVGTLEYPEQSATLVIQLETPPKGPLGLQLRGPGIRDWRGLPDLGLSPPFWVWRQAARERYPLGIDLLFVHADQVWAIPRSTELTLEAPCTSR